MQTIRAGLPARCRKLCAKRGRLGHCLERRWPAKRPYPWGMAIVAEAGVVDELRQLLPPEQVLWRDYDLMLYEYDGSIDKHRPLAVVFPLSSDDVSRVVRACDRFNVPYTARGAGTGLSGGAMPSHGGGLISLARMNRILEIDVDNMRAIVEPGVVN